MNTPSQNPNASVQIPESWKPTSANINALPDPLRRYIHDLETRCDPAGDIAALAILTDQHEAALKLIASRRPEIELSPALASRFMRLFKEAVAKKDHEINYVTAEFPEGFHSKEDGDIVLEAGLRAVIASLLKESERVLLDPKECAGTRCAGCRDNLDSSHDGCRIRQLRAKLDCTEAERDRARTGAQHDAFWRGKAEEALEQTRRRQIQCELDHQDQVEFLRAATVGDGVEWPRPIAELRAEADRLRVRCEALEDELLSYRHLAPVGSIGSQKATRPP